MIDKTLGHYQIIEKIGEGGMGEVYQAKDLKLGRNVAIKVLPEEFAKDTDRVARFEREATLLASLNHPNIAAIHGLEESGDTQFLVLELVEGQTLRDRIKSGPIPVEETLKLALQIAEALEAAHEKGIIHRDLKPGNIKVTPEGKVKVLDFGLAKAFAGERADLDLSKSPTLSEAATQQGVILGTAGYMSPEQARGESVDKRADIWAFGVVLFEMLTGRAMFEGRTVSDTLAAVLMREPEWKRLPLNLHPRIRLLLERCLEKEAKNRYSGITDARVDIEKALVDPSGVLVQPVTVAEPRNRLRTILPWIAAVIILSAITGAIVWNLRRPEAGRVVRFEYELPEGQQFNLDPISGIPLAVSPDGSQFAYGTAEGLYLRSMDALDARLIAGTDGTSYQPFFSPDGQWIGYWSRSDNKLKKVATSGGAPVALCDTGTVLDNASWNSDNTILYADIMSRDILRISANGGTPQSLIKGIPAKTQEGVSPFAPQMLPDGKTILFSNAIGALGTNKDQIVVQSLKSGERKVVLESGSYARYLPTGHIGYGVFANNTWSLFAVPFDLDTLEVTGGPVSILEGVETCAFSDSGTLVYVAQQATAAGSAGATSSGKTLVWVDKQGKEEPLGTKSDAYGLFKISPDGTRVALSVGEGVNTDIWIWDLKRETLMRLTFDEGIEDTPLWTPDSQRIVYHSQGMHESTGGVYWKAANGTGEAEKLYSAPDRAIFPYSWSKDGKTLVVQEVSPSSLQTDIAMLSMEGDHARTPLLQGKNDELQPQISPDGRWMAYVSDETTKNDVFVCSFPDVNKGGKWQISTSGGDTPLWSPDGRELFYRSGDSLMAVAVETEPTFRPGSLKVLFKGAYIPGDFPLECIYWDIHPDGKRFLMMKTTVPPGAASVGSTLQQKINIVLNWFEELKQRVPVK